MSLVGIGEDDEPRTDCPTTVTTWGAREVGYLVFFCVESLGLFLLLAASSIPIRVLGGVIILGAYLVAGFPGLRRSIDKVKARDGDSDSRRAHDDSPRRTE